MNRLTRRVFLFLTGWVLTNLGFSKDAIGKDEESGLSAEEILHRMGGIYAKCKTYRDSGCVITVLTRAERQDTLKKPFSTAFARPDRFRFEFKSALAGSAWRRFIVWRGGMDVRIWWEIRPGIEKVSSLSLALAAATGVSGGSAHIIPVLLMPDSIEGKRLTDLSELSRLTDGKIASVDCYRIKGKLVTKDAEIDRFRKDLKKTTGKDAGPWKNGPQTLWIDKSSLLLLRIDTETQFESFREESTTTYEPMIDAQISDKQLQFEPPHEESGP
jgi:outer membrane lipoprotein-sorting protein